MMILGLAHARLTRTSSDLRSLSAALLPPSPILEANDFSTSSTSGEIPILLGTTTHVCASINNEEPLALCDVIEEPGLTCRYKATLAGSRMYEESSDTCTIAGLPDGRYRNTESPGGPSCLISAICGEIENGVVPHHDLFAADARPRPSALLGNRFDHLQLLGEQGGAEGQQDSQASRSSTMESNCMAATPEEGLDGDQLVTSATFHTYSTLPTPTFALPSPSPSADIISPLSSPVGRQRHRRPLERARAVRFQTRPKSPRTQSNEPETDLTHSTPPSPTTHVPRPQYQELVPVSTRSCAADHIPDTVHPFVRHIELPEELLWIKHMTIELWIDQEGFRSVRPSMQLVGYSPRSRSLHPYEPAKNAGPNVTAGVVEFMPAKREAFTFHYATLDSPPMLRMVSVASDESRDYISRQATLGIKTNGAYTVIGTETFIASTLNNDPHGHRLQNVRMRWKFDYFVSDRKADGTGKVLSGEKTLTPLTFSCSPYLFHQSQGKKTGLMHVMKKNLATKLASQKLEPPSYTPNHGVWLQTSHYLSPERDAVTHVRSRSDALSSQSGRHPVTRSPPDAGVKVRATEGAPRTRRRRASSAGENSLACYGGIVLLKEGTFLSDGSSLLPGVSTVMGSWD